MTDPVIYNRAKNVVFNREDQNLKIFAHEIHAPNTDLSDLIFTISGSNMQFRNNAPDASNSLTLKVPDQFTIKPSGDASGIVIIDGNLEVRGKTTTIQSSQVDISDLAIRVASNVTDISSLQYFSDGGAGIIVGASNNDLASILYKYDEDWTGVGDVSAYWLVSGDLRIQDTLTTSDNNAKIPTTYNTFNFVKNTQTGQRNLTVSAELWHSVNSLDISLNTISKYSPLKLDYKVNFRASYESGQTISFRVLRDSSLDVLAGYDNCGTDIDTISGDSIKVFEDAFLGPQMGTGNRGVYSSFWVDLCGNSYKEGQKYDPDVNTTFRLQYKINDRDTLSEGGVMNISAGIMCSPFHVNIVSIQELYSPETRI